MSCTPKYMLPCFLNNFVTAVLFERSSPSRPPVFTKYNVHVYFAAFCCALSLWKFQRSFTFVHIYGRRALPPLRSKNFYNILFGALQMHGRLSPRGYTGTLLKFWIANWYSHPVHIKTTREKAFLPWYSHFKSIRGFFHRFPVRIPVASFFCAF